jgi:hypothetical protein
MPLRTRWPVNAILLLLTGTLFAQTAPQKATLIQPTMTAPGSPPFHMKAMIYETDDPENKTNVEILWMAPNRWRRTIQSDEFTQTLIVNDGKVFEKDEDDYLPLYLQTLTTAMVDPQQFLDALRPGDRLETQASGSRMTMPFCANLRGNDAEKFASICGTGVYAEMETVGAPGHPVMFADYRKFKRRKVARLLISIPEVGVSYRAVITELDELKKPDLTRFEVAESTPLSGQIRAVILSEAEMRELADEKHEIIWPQVLDGQTKGAASYYVSVDRTGKVRETVVVKSDNERANDSARRQILKWKFKPAMKDGAPVQAESILTFDLNTRAFGPPERLSNEEVRKLASNVVEPEIAPRKYPAGTVYSLRAAIDHEGNVIEVIADSGPPELFTPCYAALKKWKFNPILENGQPRPYRAEIRFKTP